jgi:tetratricopeptide (TPR) repeat protein
LLLKSPIVIDSQPSNFNMTSRIISRLACLLALSWLAAAAHADVLGDAGRLLQQGQAAEALQKVERFLTDKPTDAQGQFLKGLILSELNKLPEAIAVLTRLTEEYPELPEPYNNLAVIYARQQQYDKARQSLELAIRANPAYATAHENLGDIYARLASQAYDQAMQLDGTSGSARTKLAMVRELLAIPLRTAGSGGVTAPH